MALELVMAAVAGLCVGSFLNVCIDRIPARQSLVRPPSHCEGCDRKLSIRDLVPVASYLTLRGKCRTCGAAIPRRVLLVEIATAVVFTFFMWYFGPGLQLAIALIYACLFLVIFVIDLEHLIIPNRIVYPAMLLALAFSSFWGGFEGFWPGIGTVNALLGGAIGLVLMLLPFLLFPNGLGMGDVKLAAFMGLACGFPLIFVALMLGILYGGLVAILLLLLGVKGRKDAIPFGPFLAGGAVLTLLWGSPIMEMYQSAMTSIASLL